MKLKRFTAPDIRQAMAKVREELGGDAVILSNRKTDDGIEIIAATDYDDAVVDSTDVITESSPVMSASMNNVQQVIKAKKKANNQTLQGGRNANHSKTTAYKQNHTAIRNSPKSPTASGSLPDALSGKNTRKLASYLEDALDIPTPSRAAKKSVANTDAMANNNAERRSQRRDGIRTASPTSSPQSENRSTSRWKEALDDDYEDDTNELEDLLSMDDPTDAGFVPNQTQVSSEWINQFSSKNEEEPESEPVDQPIAQNQRPEDMENVWNELSSLRGLLETQLSSLAWSDVSKRHPVKSKTLKHLLELGLTPEMSYELLEKIDDGNGLENNFETCWRKSLAIFAKRMLTIEDDMIKKGGVFALVGPTGVGKTTTIAKMAARYALAHGTSSIALVTTDNYRIGAQEQLRTYGRILGTPVKIANNAKELRQVLKSLYDKDLVLIDTAGTSQRDIRLTEQFSMLSEGSALIKSYLVLSASSQQQVLSETVDAYKKVHLDGCVLTKLDESITLGGALSTIVKNKLPLAYVSDGQRVPEDLHLAKAVELVKKSVSMMNNAQIKLDDNVLEMAFGGLAAHDLS